MGIFTKKVIIKKTLIVFITIIMVSNFIMPNYVCAGNFGGKLVAGFFRFSSLFRRCRNKYYAKNYDGHR